jgi:hypothetical protein
MVGMIPENSLRRGECNEAVLRTDRDETLIDAAKPLRVNVSPNENGFVEDFVTRMPKPLKPNRPIASSTSGM